MFFHKYIFWNVPLTLIGTGLLMYINSVCVLSSSLHRPPEFRLRTSRRKEGAKMVVLASSWDADSTGSWSARERPLRRIHEQDRQLATNRKKLDVYRPYAGREFFSPCHEFFDGFLADVYINTIRRPVLSSLHFSHGIQNIVMAFLWLLSPLSNNTQLPRS